MTSTNNKNTPGNYLMQQNMYHKQHMYQNCQGIIINDTTCYPGDGLLPSRHPHIMLSHNSTDIESYLFGVGSTNLVTIKQPIQPKFKNIKSLSIYEKSNYFLPEPLIVEKYQRPYPSG